MKKRSLRKHFLIDDDKKDKEYCRAKQRTIGFIPWRPSNSKLKRRRRTSFSVGVRSLIAELTSF